MNKAMYVLCIVFSLLFAGHVTAQTVPLRPIANYYLDSKIELHKNMNCMVVTNKKQFDKLFGIAATNPVDKPNFEKEMALVLAIPPSNKEIELQFDHATLIDNNIEVYYTEKKHNDPLTYTSQALALAAIPKNKAVNMVKFYKRKAVD